ncbi:hypothetical protein B0J14DRAFT_705411 [Halenospora varia]|nr:hypothetical protein B0J14DRAFT_705411 [Halenospora varia]
MLSVLKILALSLPLCTLTLSLKSRQDLEEKERVNTAITAYSNNTNAITLRVNKLVEIANDPLFPDGPIAFKQDVARTLCSIIFSIHEAEAPLRKVILDATIGSSNINDATFANRQIVLFEVGDIGLGNNPDEGSFMGQ